MAKIRRNNYIFKDVQNINSPASNLSAMIDAINTASNVLGTITLPFLQLKTIRKVLY